MEYVAGETLQQKLDRVGPLDTLEVLSLGRQIADGLAAAHAMGLIHRDIKPSNILLDNGVVQRVRITDFGLARTADDASLTQSGFIAGTPMYMAPEQAEGRAIDQRADVFSLGSVLYVMCSGRPPFRASTTLAVLKRVSEDTPRPIREIIPEVPEWLCAIVARLHAKDPIERFQSAKEVADLLSQHLAHVRQPTLAPLPASLLPTKEGPASRAGRDSTRPHRAPESGSARRTWFGTHGLRRKVLIASLSFCVLACLLWAIIWLTRDKKQPSYTQGVATPVPLTAPFAAGQAPKSQNDWSRYLGVSWDYNNSAGIHMVLVPPGEFLMGMTAEEVKAALKDKDSSHWLYNNYLESSPQHKVTISKPLYMAATEVTVGQFRAFIADTGYRTEAERDGKGGIRWDEGQKKLVQEPTLLWNTPGYEAFEDMPVTQITWSDAVAYCNWLSQREGFSPCYVATRESWDPVPGNGYRLPTEAEWEYACRAGTNTLYYCGNDEDSLLEYAWLSTNANGHPRAVATKKGNAFGLYDMHGNGVEFCQDYYDANSYEHSKAIDPHGPDGGTAHVRRGGDWANNANAALSALRMSLLVHDRQWSTGFRIVRELPNVSGGKIENP
jgi:formylglycine-generating enzyme required for sulfatase activity